MRGSILRPYQGGLSPENWRDQAACQGLPSHWFGLQDFDEVDMESQGIAIARGLRVCSGCPVRAACESEANEEDRHWTTRGGRPPEGLFEDSIVPKIKLAQAMPGGYRPGVGPAKPKAKFCKRGHDDWIPDGPTKRRCHTCQKEASAWAKDKRNKAVKGT